MDVCTVVARNYLAAARVLARSFAAHNPGGTCWVLVIDDVEHEVRDEAEPFRLLRPEQLGINTWNQMAAGYSVLELSTAVKPWLLHHLLHEQGVGRITFLDPDIQVFDSLADVDELLGEHAVVVNPHLTDPLPRDGQRPTETDILTSGSFNLGFAGFAAGQQVDALLDWWAERLATDCLVAPERGYFVDQRWMDFAPGLIPSLFVLRDPGYNVAYWNLPAREVQREGARYMVNRRPLRFFHFSGYDPDRPELLSKHQDRIHLDAHPVLRELCDAYGAALADAGHASWRRRPYAWGALPDGTPLDAAARSVYRRGVGAGSLGDSSVFDEPGASALLAYLRGPAEHGGDHGVNRYLQAVRDARPDLRRNFADLDGLDGGRLVAWAELATDEVPRSLLPGGPDGPKRSAVDAAGYFKGVMGVGEHGRQLVRALQTQGIPVHLTFLQPDVAPEDDALARVAGPQTDGDTAAFNLLCANAESVPAVARQLGEGFFAGRYTIGFWAWEVSAFPERYAAAFAYLDEVWVGSRHVQDAIAPVATVPVLAVPQPVSLPPDFAAAAPPAGLPQGFRFLFAFDYLSVFDRKNPLATVQAFTRAFAPGSGAVLIIKTLNPDYDPDAHERLRTAAADHPDIHLMQQRLSAHERDGLLNAADCYVSLHRAEGFGYTLAESMWAGKPVIATGYSGNLDYMTPDNSYLVDHRLVPIGPGSDPYPADGRWAEPDVDHAARLMREVFEHRDEASRRGREAAADIRRTHSPEAAGRFLAQRLRRVLASPQAAAAQRTGHLYTEWLTDLIRSGPVPPPGRPRFGGAQRLARRGLLRALKPIIVHERLVDGELLRAVEKLDANLQSLSLAHASGLRRIAELQGQVHDLERSSFAVPVDTQPDSGTVEAQANEQRSGRS